MSEYDKFMAEAKKYLKAYNALAKRDPVRAARYKTLYEQALARAEGARRDELAAGGKFDVDIRPSAKTKPQSANRPPSDEDATVTKDRILTELVGFSADDGDGLCSLYLRDPAGMNLTAGPQRISDLKANEGWPICSRDCTKHETDDPTQNTIKGHTMYRYSIPFDVAHEYIRPEGGDDA